METPKERLQVICRPARPGDRQEVFAFLARIWGDEVDYITSAWESWLAEPYGRLIVAEHAGRAIGLAKLTRLSEQDWWMQGMRVDPEFQGRGVATQLQEALLKAWEELGSGTVRLATASFRTPIHILCQRTGFSAALRFSLFTADPIQEPAWEPRTAFRAVELGEMDQALDFALGSETLRLSQRHVDMCWEWLPLRRDHLEGVVQEELAWWWQERHGLIAAWRDSEWGYPMLALHFAACDLGKLTDLLLDIRRLAGSQAFTEAGWTAALVPQQVEALVRAGFRRKVEHYMVLYEKKHGTSPGKL